MPENQSYGPYLVEERESAERQLTQDQINVCDAISRGLTIRETADFLGLSLGAVVGRQQRGFRNLGVNSAIQATIELYSRGQLPRITEYDDREDIYLTERQHEIIILVLEGLSDREISERLELGVSYINGIINQLARDSGFGSRVEMVRYFLQTGGPKLHEAKDRTAKFLEVVDGLEAIGYGTYSKWIAKIFIAFPKRPVTKEAVAKVLFGEIYSDETKAVFADRAGSLLQGSLKNPGEKGKIEIIGKELAQLGLGLIKDYAYRGKVPVSRFIAWPLNEDFRRESLGNELTDEELREFAIQLRIDEVEYRKKQLATSGVEAAWSELERSIRTKQNHYRYQKRKANQALDKADAREQAKALKVQRAAALEVKAWKAAEEQRLAEEIRSAWEELDKSKRETLKYYKFQKHQALRALYKEDRRRRMSAARAQATAERQISAWKAMEEVYHKQDETEIERRILGLPRGFLERIEELETKLRNPPPHVRSPLRKTSSEN